MLVTVCLVLSSDSTSVLISVLFWSPFCSLMLCTDWWQEKQGLWAESLLFGEVISWPQDTLLWCWSLSILCSLWMRWSRVSYGWLFFQGNELAVEYTTLITIRNTIGLRTSIFLWKFSWLLPSRLWTLWIYSKPHGCTRSQFLSNGKLMLRRIEDYIRSLH